MESNKVIKERLFREGFSEVNEYNDLPNEVFPEHNHPGDQLLIVLDGSISITMEGKTVNLEAGDELFFPATVNHSAQVGLKGCSYVVGERHV
jgi:mannose-6-phosphate isomerase-like protein (cupin superfamily)